jgi:hypothetical protein
LYKVVKKHLYNVFLIFFVSELSKYFGGKVLSSGSNSIRVLITFDENVPEPKTGKFEVDDEDLSDRSRLDTEISFNWRELVEPRLVSE